MSRARFLSGLVSIPLVCVALAAGAEELVLIDQVPARIEPAVALKAAREALVYRSWNIVDENASSVTATISRQGIEGRIRIRVAGRRVFYQESGRGRPKMDFTGKPVSSAAALPERWINYLRSDITESLEKLSATPPAPPAAAETTPRRSEATRRMQALKEMFDGGLISADEYEIKRAEILRDL